MSGHHDPLQCFVPPYVLEHMADNSPNPSLRQRARRTLMTGSAARAARMLYTDARGMAAPPWFMGEAIGGKKRLIYTMNQQTWGLPGELVRREGQNGGDDPAVDEAYEGAGHTYDFYAQQFSRDSLDNSGMPLILSVHYGYQENNAYWNGQQMLFGDGDGATFVSFTASLEVIGHELTHGVVQYESALEYYQQPGALNEHFADVMGILVEHWRSGRPVAELGEADWDIGAEIIAPAARERGVRGIRTMTAARAFENDPDFGTDPQPKHLDRYYNGTADYGGVHINSGIPNHAFYLLANALGGNSWETAGRIWYETMCSLSRYSQFQDAADTSCGIAGARFGGNVRDEVARAWRAVGIEPRV